MFPAPCNTVRYAPARIALRRGSSTHKDCEGHQADQPTAHGPRPDAGRQHAEAEPVEKAPEGAAREQPPPSDPTPAGDVRAPVAADLAEYTKDIQGNGKLMATIETSMGTFHCELFGDKAPMTVANFVGLATGKKAWMNPKTGNVEKGKPFFDGLMFHRVIPRLHDPGRRSARSGHRRPRLQLQRRDLAGPAACSPACSRWRTPACPTATARTAASSSSPRSRRTGSNGKHTIFGQCKEVDLVKKIASVPKRAERQAERRPS